MGNTSPVDLEIGRAEAGPRPERDEVNTPPTTAMRTISLLHGSPRRIRPEIRRLQRSAHSKRTAEQEY
jgi:hypothetical protein